MVRERLPSLEARRDDERFDLTWRVDPRTGREEVAGVVEMLVPGVSYSESSSEGDPLELLSSTFTGGSCRLDFVALFAGIILTISTAFNFIEVDLERVGRGWGSCSSAAGEAGSTFGEGSAPRKEREARVEERVEVRLDGRGVALD